jgi:hypothetical protein
LATFWPNNRATRTRKELKMPARIFGVNVIVLIVLAVGYVLGAKFPAIAQKFGIA